MKYALELTNLTKIYANKKIALQDVTLQIEAGDFYALLGANGAGKSTLIGIISNLINKTRGEVKICSQNLHTAPLAAKQYLGLVPQEFNFNLFEKVLQIVVTQAAYYGVPAKLAHTRAEYYLRQLDLWNKRDERAIHLSGGMKRRLMIARALMHEPKVLILDEPSAGVDLELRQTMWLFLQQLNKEKKVTIILTTHYLEEAETLCRHIGILQAGRLIKNGPMPEFLAQIETEQIVFELSGGTHPPHLSGYQYQLIDKHSLEIVISRQQGLNDIFRQLDAQGHQIQSVRNKTNRLESLFFALMNQQESSTNEAK